MNKALSMISLCMKAGKLISGEFSVEAGLKEGNVCLVILATDASDNTKKKFNNMCTYRNIECIELGTKEELGKALGKEFRASIGIVDDGFAKSIKSKII